MPQPPKLETATFEEVWLNKNGQETPPPSGKKKEKFKVQFNPQTLKLNYTNQKAGGEQPKGSSTQFVGKAVTKLTLELWFDIARANAELRKKDSKAELDVRSLTQEIAYFLAPQKVPGSGKDTTTPPPGLRFHWGTFTFVGTMDSMDETLEFFSPDGKPLRASVSISISKQEIQYDANKAANLKDPQSAGIQPYTPIPAGKPFQQLATQAGATSGGPSDWKNLALANGIENPRMLAAGALVNLSAGVSLSASAQLGVSAQTSGQLSASIGVGVQGGASAGFNAQAGAGIGASVGVQSGASTSASGGIKLGFAGSA